MNSDLKIKKFLERQPWETGLEDSRLLLLYTTQNYTSILGLFLFCVLVGTVT